jgi:hypothetical protein
VFKSNFQGLKYGKNLNFFLDLQYLLFSLKKIAPLLLSTKGVSKNILFVFKKSLYSQTLLNESRSNCNTATGQKLGLFTNFSIINRNNPLFLNNKVLPCFVITFFLQGGDSRLVESANKKIPSIGLVTPGINSDLTTYPIFCTLFYYYGTYLFNKFLITFLLINE